MVGTNLTSVDGGLLKSILKTEPTLGLSDSFLALNLCKLLVLGLLDPYLEIGDSTLS